MRKFPPKGHETIVLLDPSDSADGKAVACMQPTPFQSPTLPMVPETRQELSVSAEQSVNSEDYKVCHAQKQ